MLLRDLWKQTLSWVSWFTWQLQHQFSNGTISEESFPSHITRVKNAKNIKIQIWVADWNFVILICPLLDFLFFRCWLYVPLYSGIKWLFNIYGPLLVIRIRIIKIFIFHSPTIWIPLELPQPGGTYFYPHHMTLQSYCCILTPGERGLWWRY